MVTFDTSLGIFEVHSQPIMSHEGFSRWILDTLNVQGICLICLASLLFYYAYRGLRFNSRSIARPLPGPWSWPVIGSIPSIMWYSKHHGHRAFTEMAKRYGPVFGVMLGPAQYMVVLNDKRTIREAFVTQSAKMTDRPIPGLVKISFPVQGSLGWESGKIWSARRRFILRAFRTLGFSKSGILGQRIQEEAKALCASFDEYGGLPFNPKRLLEYAASNLFCSIALGDRYEYKDPVFCSLVNNSRVVLDNLSAVSIGNFFPFLYHSPVCREYREAANYLTEFIRGLVDHHKENFNGNEMRDVVDLYLEEVRRMQDKREDGVKFHEEDVWRSMIDLLIGGSFSVSSHVMWTLLFTTQYPDVQERIHKEIDSAVGDRAPSLDDRDSLPFTRATLLEVMRCRVGTLSIPHLANDDAVVGGCFIPKGSHVMANLWALHHDPLVWEEPEKFNPCRFLSGDESATVLPDYFMPFGAGPRTCPGEQLAKHQVFLLFASIMQKYKLVIPESEPTPDMEGKACGPALQPVDFRLCTIKR
ncbi:cytochrome P450 2J4-like isoform X1 [Asterias amurensis]|uniref:cytochrome P450 2J4-like isoform X1 n=2 Tax=Asterias amurensis TaxID=7602 RepID=UPI003AB50483